MYMPNGRYCLCKMWIFFLKKKKAIFHLCHEIEWKDTHERKCGDDDGDGGKWNNALNTECGSQWFSKVRAQKKMRRCFFFFCCDDLINVINACCHFIARIELQIVAYMFYFGASGWGVQSTNEKKNSIPAKWIFFVSNHMRIRTNNNDNNNNNNNNMLVYEMNGRSMDDFLGAQK